MQEPFRITKACVEMSTAGETVSSLMIECENNEEFIIANLRYMMMMVLMMSLMMFTDQTIQLCGTHLLHQ